jgi:hypothetical protein
MRASSICSSKLAARRALQRSPPRLPYRCALLLRQQAPNRAVRLRICSRVLPDITAATVIRRNQPRLTA